MLPGDFGVLHQNHQSDPACAGMIHVDLSLFVAYCHYLYTFDLHVMCLYMLVVLYVPHLQANACLCSGTCICTVSVHLPGLFPCRQGYRSSTKKPWEDRTQPLVRSRYCCINTAFTGPASHLFFCTSVQNMTSTSATVSDLMAHHLLLTMMFICVQQQTLLCTVRCLCR